MEEETIGDNFDGIDSYASTILDAKYKAASATEIIQNHCGHLDPDQQKDIKECLKSVPNYLTAS